MKHYNIYNDFLFQFTFKTKLEFLSGPKVKSEKASSKSHSPNLKCDDIPSYSML